MSKRIVPHVFKAQFDHMLDEFLELVQTTLGNADYMTASNGRLQVIASDVSDAIAHHAKWNKKKKRWELLRYKAYPIWLHRYRNHQDSTVIGWCVLRDLRKYINAQRSIEQFRSEWLSANLIAVRLGYENFMAYVCTYNQAQKELTPQAITA